MRLFSTEQVSKYHPDKYADQISDAMTKISATSSAYSTTDAPRWLRRAPRHSFSGTPGSIYSTSRIGLTRSSRSSTRDGWSRRTSGGFCGDATVVRPLLRGGLSVCQPGRKTNSDRRSFTFCRVDARCAGHGCRSRGPQPGRGRAPRAVTQAALHSRRAVSVHAVSMHGVPAPNKIEISGDS